MSDKIPPPAPLDSAPPLALALEQSHDVKSKVEELAENLADTNRDVEQKIAAGATTLSARHALTGGQDTEAKVQECADDLHDVTETLASGIADLQVTVDALTHTQAALVTSQAALVVAQEDAKAAEHRALHDSATGLPNRELFDDRTTHAISLAERHGWSLALMFIDLDKFKAVNDTHGHGAGDTAVETVAARLLECSREEDTVCRAGGDEFLFLLVDAGQDEQIRRVATRIAECVSQPFQHGDIELTITPSIGVAIYPRHGRDVNELVASADAAMYRAKSSTASVEICEG
jgi:diguanylate cyclase (GGDEF)-like protein